jgi:predicted RNase H-like HicB family nuclease
VFILMFKFLPKAAIRWRDVLPGAVATSLLLLIGNRLIGLYLGYIKPPKSDGLYWSDDDHAFVAKVPELLCWAARGASQEEALRNAQEAIRLWLDTAKEFGDLIPERKGRRLIFA